MNQQPNGKAHGKQDRKPFLPGGLVYIVLTGVVLFGALYWLARAFAVTTEKYTFYAQGGINILIFAAILAQVLIYRRQWDAMERQTAISQTMIDNARESFYLSERAYMGLKTFKIESLVRDQSPVLKMLFINGGRTPAWNVTVQMALNVGKEPNLSQDWTEGQPADSEAFVPAGETFNGSGIQPDPIPAKSVVAVENEIAKLFVVGVCRYKDIMERDRVYPFCLAYKPRQRVFKHYKGTKEQPQPN